MKALVLWGLNESLQYEDFPEPILSGDEVIIEVKAAAFNRRDYWITQGKYPGIVFPTILGSDGAGIYKDEEVVLYPAVNWGENQTFQSTAFTILGMPNHGSFAEKVAVPITSVFPKPLHLSIYEAAALPLAGLTAYRALFTRAGLQKSDRVLITGIGGGVALTACQFALANGNDVFVTSGSDEKIEKAVKLGVQGGVNYHSEDGLNALWKMADGFDVIIDSAGGSGFSSLIKLLNPGGRICIYGGTAGRIESLNPQLIFWRQVSILGSSMGSLEEFKSMLDFVELYQVTPIIDEIFELEKGNLALQKMGQSKQFGKLVLNI